MHFLARAVQMGWSEMGLPKAFGAPDFPTRWLLCQIQRQTQRRRGQTGHKILKGTSLWTKLCEEARIRAHSNKFASCFSPFVTSCARLKFHAHILGMIFDLHLQKNWDTGADPLRKLRDGQIPTMDLMAFPVVEGHACDYINCREGVSHNWKGFTQRGRSQSKIVSVGAGTSL